MMNTMFANPFCTPTNFVPGATPWSWINGSVYGVTSQVPWTTYGQPVTGYGYGPNGWWFGNTQNYYPTPILNTTPVNTINGGYGFNQPWNTTAHTPWTTHAATTPFNCGPTPWTNWNYTPTFGYNQIPSFPNTLNTLPFVGQVPGLYGNATPSFGGYPGAPINGWFNTPVNTWLNTPVNSWFNSPVGVGFQNPGVYANTLANWNTTTPVHGVPAYPANNLNTPTVNSYGYPTTFPTPFGNNIPSPVTCAGREAA